MLTVDVLMVLIERLEKAMRPLGETPASPDHARVRELYRQLSLLESKQPLEQARLTVLHDILKPYLPAVPPVECQDTGALTHNIKAAIGALVVFLCYLDDCQFDAADTTLQAALDILHETSQLMHGSLGDYAIA